MNLKESVRSQLSRLAPFQGPAQRIEVREAERRFVVELMALDALACAFDRLSLFSSRLVGAPLPRLRAIGEALSKKLTYLLEPIHPIEIDEARCIVQMRSNPPQQDDDATTYYELLVERSGELSLCRYQKAPGCDRRVVPAHVTREVLLRLVGDMAAATE